MRPTVWWHLSARRHPASPAAPSKGNSRGVRWTPGAPRRGSGRHQAWPGALLLALALLLAACGGASSQVRHPTLTATHQPSVIYVALGASDAVGTGADDPNTQGYVPRLIARLPADAGALNLGILGETLHSALADELPSALAKRPTLVTVWLAANDFRGCDPLTDDATSGIAGYTTDLNTLLDKLRSDARAQVFVANLPDMSLLPALQPGSDSLGMCFQGKSQSQIRAMTQQWNAAIAASVARHGDALVDLYSAELASHPEYISRDGFHPTSAGYARLADLFWAQIQARHAAPSPQSP
jgi:acyl-CoA thioesterase-1